MIFTNKQDGYTGDQKKKLNVAWDILNDSSYLWLPHTQKNARLAQSCRPFFLCKLKRFKPFLRKIAKFCKKKMSVAFLVRLESAV